MQENYTTDVLIEVNIGREEAKSGVFAENLEELLFQVGELPGIRVRGLMTVPPILGTEREKRTVFSQMYKLFIDIKGKNIDNITMDTLSMGMSGDYREAILEGATIVRIGSALFGKRN
ncbi:Pyridoxal phosphate homeostasis protein [bioreactor metagenome]|uniref:Pyridoxal phosphate homeostasis protein n=1 Tax=bioreactor metagenome TaxID=1076179 RepID=A0A645GCZ0_9ZZZZ